ncbi:nucleotidyltransferase domain-containing protein [Candidatus Microgenomates bacterium]|nr:nucleotidyltransferase domain-containing protein [Candidatus Microgenomates bacterium]
MRSLEQIDTSNLDQKRLAKAQEAATIIMSVLPAEMVVLFGSSAREIPRGNSDIDLAVFMRREDRVTSNEYDFLISSLQDNGFSVGLLSRMHREPERLHLTFTRSRETLEKATDLFSMIVNDEGIVLSKGRS